MRIKRVNFELLKNCVTSGISIDNEIEKQRILNFIEDCKMYQAQVYTRMEIQKGHYSASLLKGKVNSYVIAFRNPMLKDSDGYGKKVRKGIGTDRRLAEDIVSDINKLLSDRYWHDLSRLFEAKSKFNSRAVSIFYLE